VVVEAVEAVVVVEVEVDAVEKGQRIGAVHTAARTTIQRKTAGSGRRSKSSNPANVLAKSTIMKLYTTSDGKVRATRAVEYGSSSNRIEEMHGGDE
jgi:hypothetical protein